MDVTMGQFRLFSKLVVRPILSFAIPLPRLFGWSLNTISRIEYHAFKKECGDRATMVPEVMAGHQVYWFHPKDVTKPTKKVLLYIHGGGFTSCSYKSYAKTMSILAEYTGHSIAFVEYDLAPEAKFPFALNQIQEVYEHLLDHGYQSQDIQWGGDSAGGNLALALLVKCRDEGVRLPKSVFLESPFTDFTFSGDSYVNNYKSEVILPFWPPSRELSAYWMKKLYLGDTRSDHPLVSPLFADLSGLPPLQISYSESEQLRDDALRLYSKAKSQGVAVKLVPFANTPHANFVFAHRYKEAMEALQAHGNFVLENFRVRRSMGKRQVSVSEATL